MDVVANIFIELFIIPLIFIVRQGDNHHWSAMIKKIKRYLCIFYIIICCYCSSDTMIKSHSRQMDKSVKWKKILGKDYYGI